MHAGVDSGDRVRAAGAMPPPSPGALRKVHQVQCIEVSYFIYGTVKSNAWNNFLMPPKWKFENSYNTRLKNVDKSEVFYGYL